MTHVCRSIAFACLAVAAGGSRARAGDTALIVAVEAAPGIEVAPADVRQVIATELGAAVVGAHDRAATEASDVLFVVIEPHEIRMALRAGAAPIVSRAIPVSSDRSARLRMIGWLAGNLVRDQVGPIVSAREPAPPPADPRPSREPPPLSALPAATEAMAGPDAVVAARPARSSDAPAHSTWMITAGGGPTLQMVFSGVGFPMTAGGGGVYQVEVQHQTTPDSLLLGAALEVGPSSDHGGMPHYLGAAGLTGARWRSRRWSLEGTVGLGVEAVGGRLTTVTVTNSSESMLAPVAETKVSFQPVPGLYARLQGTGGVRVSRMLDLVAQVGAHVSSNWRSASYLSSTVGVRLRLP
jgi:hypothetical protein